MSEQKTIPKHIKQPCCECGTPRWALNPAWLRSRREAKGYSLREFAKLAGFSAAYLSDVELGRRAITTKVVAAYGGMLHD